MCNFSIYNLCHEQDCCLLARSSPKTKHKSTTPQEFCSKGYRSRPSASGTGQAGLNRFSSRGPEERQWSWNRQRVRHQRLKLWLDWETTRDGKVMKCSVYEDEEEGSLRGWRLWGYNMGVMRGMGAESPPWYLLSLRSKARGFGLCEVAYYILLSPWSLHRHS